MNKSPLFLVLIFKSATLFGQFSVVSYPIAGAIYQQDFDQLPLSGSFTLNGKGPHALDQAPLSMTALKGWQVFQISGSQPNTNILTGTGSGTGSGIYSYGLSGNNNRALGSLASGTGVYGFGVVLENQTGSPLNKISIQYKITQWRKGGSGNTNTWQFSYQTRQSNSIDTTFLLKKLEANLISIQNSTGSATLNGHLSANQYSINITIKDIIWRPGEKLILRWDDQDESGSDDGMAIDDFNFSATTEIIAPVIGKPFIDSIGTQTVNIVTSVQDNLSNTQVKFEYDTTPTMYNPINATTITPNVIASGAGNTFVTLRLSGLSPGRKYYARAIANNTAGTTISDTIQFTTITSVPDISTHKIIAVDFGRWEIFGELLSDNGAVILEKGFCWAINDTPFIHHNRSPVSLTDADLRMTLKDLPLNAIILIRSYARNEKGIGYGIPLSFRTLVSVHSFTSSQTYSNKDTLVYELILHQTVEAINTSQFTVKSIPENGAAIYSVERKNDSSYTIKIQSGNSDAIIQPILHRDVNQSPPIHPLFYEGTKTIIDKTPPEILNVSIPDRSYKIKDTIQVTISTRPDPSSFILWDGNVSGYPVSQLRKQNDSTYTAIAIVNAGGAEIKASETHFISLHLKDSANNKNQVHTFKIQQDNDAIDHSRPTIKSLTIPPRKKYKVSDTLYFGLHFNEKIQCDTSMGKPVISVTIGTRIRNPVLSFFTDTSLYFTYVIQSDEFDADGIRIANTLSLNNSVIQDPAGNLVLNNIPSAGILSDILIDAILPEVIGVITPTPRSYGINDTLRFIVLFSKPVVTDPKKDPFLETVIGDNTYKIPYRYGAPGNSLTFELPILNGMLDKNGISLSNQLFQANTIIDDIGNTTLPLLRNIGALSSIDVDGIPPKWITNSDTIIAVCEKGQLRLDKFLLVDDEEKAGGLTWNIIRNSKRGNITGLPYNTKLTIDIQEPKNLIYNHTNDASLKDTAIIEVSDGINSIRKQFIFQFFPEITNNILSKDQIICSGTAPEPIKGEMPVGGNEMYAYQWQMSSQSQFQSIPSNSLSILYPGSLQQSTRFRRIVQSGGCTDTSQSVLIEVKTNGLWLGKQNNSWHTGSNWCSAMVPDMQTDVILQTNDSPVLITDSAFCRSLQLLNQSQLILSGVLTYDNTILAQQAIRSSNGTLVAAGKRQQYLPAQAFMNNKLDHLVAKGTELLLSDSLYINRSLQLIQGKLLTQDMLVLDSQAMIAPNAAGTQIIGRIFKKFRLENNWITHPFKEDILGSSKNFQQVGPNISYAILKEQENANMVPITLMALTNFANKKIIDWKPLEQENNYSLYRWKRSSGISLFKPFDKKVKADVLLFGQPIIGDEEIIFPTGKDTQYHLTGNPYLAKILSKSISRSQNIGHNFWVWDNSLAETGGYAAKAFDGNHIIEALQGFIVKTTKETDLSIRFSEQTKITESLPDSINGIIENRYQVALSLHKEQQLLDRFLLIDIDSSSIRFDEDDAEKLFNQYYNFYSLSYDQIPLAIDARKITDETYIPLGIQTKAPGYYSIQFNRVWLPSHLSLELHDLFNGTITKVKSDSFYHFYITADTTSFGEKRFVLRAPIPPVPQEEPIILKLSPVPAQYQLNVYFKAYKPGHSFILIKNIDGAILHKQILGQQKEGNFQVPLNALLNGTYILEVHSGNKFAASTFIKL